MVEPPIKIGIPLIDGSGAIPPFHTVLAASCGCITLLSELGPTRSAILVRCHKCAWEDPARIAHLWAAEHGEAA